MPHKHIALTIFSIILSTSAIAQDGGYSVFRSFTVTDGLPSNHIYACVEDDKGFLWVATDGGIARFDGKHFQVFTTKDGLPDNDVLDVVKENNGRIWVNCFKQSPAYFDEVKNRFINSTQDPKLATVQGTTILYVTALPDGGVMYWNENGSYFFKDNTVAHISYVKNGFFVNTIIKKLPGNNFIGFGIGLSPFRSKIMYIENGIAIDSTGESEYKRNSYYTVNDNKLYMFDYGLSGYIYVYSDFKTSPFSYKIDSLHLDGAISWIRPIADYFTVIQNGKLLLFDKNSMRLSIELYGNYSPNSLYKDSKNNIWISSIDKGLLLYKQRQIEIFSMPDNFTNTNFLSITKKNNGPVLAGNFYGQVIETDGRYFIAHDNPAKKNPNWQRKIIVSQHKVFTFGEVSTFIDFKIPMVSNTGFVFQTKTAAVLNDSIIIQGNVGGLYKLNTKKNVLVDRLGTFTKRTTAIAVAADNIIYHGSTDGLYRYDYNKHRDSSLSKVDPLFNERIVSICYSPDGYVWVATASYGIKVLHNDSIVASFSSNNGLINNNIKCISTGRLGEIWIGTNNGISVIRYTNKLADFKYQNLTINDGLNSNIINEMVYSNDTIYCATGNGICAIPANIALPEFNIRVQLTGITINNIDTLLASNYELSYYQNNITLHLAGVEPGGHFNYFQYSIDNKEWQVMEANILTLQLSSGSHSIKIRAIDVNGNPGKINLLLTFNIATAFWKAIWFWIIIAFLSVGLLAWIMVRREKAKKEISLQQMLNQKKLMELELQALKSQINPHFIFNCLNSIKFLSHQQKHADAEKYLDRFAALLRSALEQSSLQQITLQQEIDFIDNYLALEKLRMAEKLSYAINYDAAMDTKKILIPSMLLQPHIENAIKHGIAPLKNKNGFVQINFYMEKGKLVAAIEDNGVGFNEEKNSNGTGIGIENTQRRSKLYNISSSITDLNTIDKDLTGTRVILTIPFKNCMQ